MNTPNRRRRVIVSATCFADADAAIKIAARLARKIQGDVLGLLIEDEAISRYAELPFAKTLAFQPATQQPVTSRAMRIAFERDAQRFKTILAKAARNASIEWSFESKRGKTIPLLHSTASKGDFILLGYQQMRASQGEIICLIDAGGNDASLLNIGKTLAQEMNIPLHQITLINHGKETPDKSSGRQLAHAHLISDQSTTISTLNRDELLEYLRKSSPTAVFATAHIDNGDYLSTIQEAARCSVVLSIQN